MANPSLTKNTTYYTAALTVQKILAFIYFWLISSQLFPSQLGQYVFALSFSTMFSIFVDMGLSPILTREAAKSHEKANLYLKNVLALKIPLAVITLVAAWIVINITNKPADVRTLVYLATAIMLLDSFSLSFWVIFRARQNLKYESIATIFVQIIIFTLGVAALFATHDVKYLMLALLSASFFNFFLSLALLKIKLKFSLKPAYNPEIAKYFIKIVPAFALAGIFVKIYNTSDSVLLGYLASDAAVGFYAVPAKVVYALQQVLPAAFAAVIFPAFSYYYANDKIQLEKTFEKAFNYLTIVSLPITAGLIILIPEIINSVWPTYARVIPTFYAMSLAIPFIFLAFPTGYLLNSCDRQNQTTLNRGLITALSVILNIILIRQLSYLGAGITFFVTNFILLFMDFYWVAKVIPLKFKVLGMTLLKSVAASAIMILVIYLAKPYLHLTFLVPLGVAVYFASLLALKGFTIGEVREMVRKGIK